MCKLSNASVDVGSAVGGLANKNKREASRSNESAREGARKRERDRERDGEQKREEGRWEQRAVTEQSGISNADAVGVVLVLSAVAKHNLSSLG